MTVYHKSHNALQTYLIVGHSHVLPRPSSLGRHLGHLNLGRVHGLLELGLRGFVPALAGGLVVLLLRAAALRWSLELPRFEEPVRRREGESGD